MPSFATTLAKAVYLGRNDPVAFVPGDDDDTDVEPVDQLLYSPSFEKLLRARVAQLPYSPEYSW